MERLQLDEMLVLASKVENWDVKRTRERHDLYFGGILETISYRSSIEGVSIDIVNQGDTRDHPAIYTTIRAVSPEGLVLGAFSSIEDKGVSEFYLKLQKKYPTQEVIAQRNALQHARQLISQ